ncbi:MAG TPA: pyruvate kinase [Terriglobales bacterium]|nr:pyruvate kinase [Terriglobales bacterium]
MQPEAERHNAFSNSLLDLFEQLSKIRAEMITIEAQFAQEIQGLHAVHQVSARNLLHYMTLRRHDLRLLQTKLASYGLSSLGRSESQVAHNLDAVLKALCCIAGKPFDEFHYDLSRFTSGKSLLEKNTAALLGPTPRGRTVRIMVTMPSEAASDYALVRDLLASGMNCMRVNGAHDDENAWAHMVENLRRAERELGQHCKVLMDLPGPKLRTGPTESIPGVLKVRPNRDRFGNVVEPAKIWLTPIENPEPPTKDADALLTVPGDWLANIETGQRLKFLDARGKARSLKVTRAGDCSRLAETDETCYLTSATILQVFKHGVSKACQIGEIPRAPQPIILRPGDFLHLFSTQHAGPVAARDDRGRYLQPPSISVTLPAIFADVRTGEKIWFDDGKIGGLIRSADKNRIVVEVVKASPKGEKLGADKGINLPDTELQLPALTADDIARLPFFARNADLVGYSFVRRPSDIHLLQTELAKVGGADLGIMLKIETRKAFERLPLLILAAMRSPRAGVMIARGDLAVECGFERTGELQEEILWIAEAAHLPVIWATQVLENLAKTGQPSRAEITDAAMAERAECVMLNKGPYIIDAVKVLDDVLRRMQRHQAKKSSLLRPLTIADNFVPRGGNNHESAIA